ncbi:MAG: CAP domain-containing protein [Syntrophomonadaceae bacterium]
MKKCFSVVLVLFLALAGAGQALAAGEIASNFQILKCDGNQTARVLRLTNAQIYLGSSGLILKIILTGSQANSLPASFPSLPTPAPAPEPPAPTVELTAGSMQQEMLGYINAERAKVNAPPLILDPSLCNGAYQKSADMAINGYFNHTSPTYGSPFAMMDNLGINYGAAAENIAMHTSVKGAHEAFMNSPGHRNNILNPVFGKLGLGFYRSGNYLYVTQWFTN